MQAKEFTLTGGCMAPYLAGREVYDKCFLVAVESQIVDLLAARAEKQTKAWYFIYSGVHTRLQHFLNTCTAKI